MTLDCDVLAAELARARAAAVACHLQPVEACGERLVDECTCPFAVVDAESATGQAYTATRQTYVARCPTACVGLVCNDVNAADCTSVNGNLSQGECVTRPN